MNELITFTVPRSPGFEWAGSQIGVANVITRSKDRLPALDRALDAKPGVRERMLTHAMRALEGHESYIHDLVLHGRRVRCFSNSHHLGDFWQENGWSVAEWRALTGQVVPAEPALSAYATIQVAAEGELSAWSKSQRQVFTFNTSFYGELRAVALEAIGAMRASAVSLDGKGALFLGGPGKSTIAFGLMEQSGARFLADDAVFIRAEGVNVQAFAAEKRIYARTALVAAFAEHAWAFLQSRFENAPDVALAYLDRNTAEIESLLTGALAAKNPAAANYFRTLTPHSTRKLLARMTAFDGTHVLVEPRAIFGARGAASNPLEPMPIHAIFVLRRDPADATVLESIVAERFKTLGGAELAPLADLPAYAVNAVFDRDPANRTRRDVALSAAGLIERTLERRPANVRFTLSNYR